MTPSEECLDDCLDAAYYDFDAAYYDFGDAYYEDMSFFHFDRKMNCCVIDNIDDFIIISTAQAVLLWSGGSGIQSIQSSPVHPVHPTFRFECSNLL